MDRLVETFLNLGVMAEMYPFLLNGLWMTLRLCIAIVPCGMIAGLVVAILFSLHFRPLSGLMIVYVDFFRSFPPLVLLIFIYYGLPFVGIEIPDFAAVVLALTLNTSSYYGEIFRAGIESIPRGQWEASRSTGLGFLQTMRYVIVPQAARNVAPDLTSNTLEVIKLTSLASVVALPELLRLARVAQGLSYNPTPLIAAAAIYFILLWPLVRLLSRMERRMIAGR